jgi:hypothetical protein
MDKVNFQGIGVPKGIKVAIDIKPQVVVAVAPVPHIDQSIGKLLVVAYLEA